MRQSEVLLRWLPLEVSRGMLILSAEPSLILDTYEQY